MDQLELLKKVLRLPQHWQVVDVESDEETRQLTVSLHFVRTRRRLLGGETQACARCGQSLAPIPASRCLQLRHLPLGDWQVNLSLPDSTGGCADRACPANAEFAEPGTRVTYAFASRMVALHTGGASLATTAALLDVDIAEVAVVLAARGMPVDALTGEITLPQTALDALAELPEPSEQLRQGPAVATVKSAQRETDEDAASAEEPPLTPIAASVAQVELLVGAAAPAAAPASGVEPLIVPSAGDSVILATPVEPEVHPVPTNTLLAADEAQAQEVFERAIEGETDALAHDSIDEHTPTGAPSPDPIDEALESAQGDGTNEKAISAEENELGSETDAADVDAEGLEAGVDPGALASAAQDSPVDTPDAAMDAVVLTASDAPTDDEARADEDASADAGSTDVGTVGEPDGAAPDEPQEPAPAPGDASVPEAQAAPDPVALPVLSVRAAAPELPPIDHAVWEALLRAELTIDTDALALQMLLARLRQFVQTSEDQSAVSAAARVLHKHLGQSVKRYAGERAQLLTAMTTGRASGAGEEPSGAPVQPQAGSSGHDVTVVMDDAMAASTIPTLQAPIPAPPTFAVPAIDDPVWRELVTGQRALITTSVALKMMLEQIKRSAQSDPSDATLLAGVRLLHTFFTKTSRQLTGELRQLHEGASTEHAPGPEVSAPVGDGAVEAVPVVQPRIPPETSPSWQALLDGRIAPSQEDPGLSMLMEKVRRVTSQGQTSGEVMAAAARVLRRYLARYARRHADLLAELNSLDLSTTTTQRTSRLSRTWRAGNRRGDPNSDVPPLEDPVWRRLMDGDLRLETDAFALRMMLERIRRSVRRDPSEGNRRAAASQLRDYFVKHERVHRAELQRIRAA